MQNGCKLVKQPICFHFKVVTSFSFGTSQFAMFKLWSSRFLWHQHGSRLGQPWDISPCFLIQPPPVAHRNSSLGCHSHHLGGPSVQTVCSKNPFFRTLNNDSKKHLSCFFCCFLLRFNVVLVVFGWLRFRTQSQAARLGVFSPRDHPTAFRQANHTAFAEDLDVGFWMILVEKKHGFAEAFGMSQPIFWSKHVLILVLNVLRWF